MAVEARNYSLCWLVTVALPILILAWSFIWPPAFDHGYVFVYSKPNLSSLLHGKKRKMHRYAAQKLAPRQIRHVGFANGVTALK
jgi:hypothetical protein